MQINVSGWGALPLLLLEVVVCFVAFPESSNGMLNSVMDLLPPVEVSA